MTAHPALVDIIRRELKRQAAIKGVLDQPYLFVNTHDKPDVVELNGLLDIEALAQAIERDG